MAFGRDIDLAVIAQKAKGEPTLLLAAIPAAPGNADQMSGQIVKIPLRRLGHEFNGTHARFLEELASGGGARILSCIDAALRHLPPLPGAFFIRRGGAAADPDAAVPVNQHDADAGPVGEVS